MYIIFPQGNGDMLPHTITLFGEQMSDRWKKNWWEADRAGDYRKKKTDVSPKDSFHACWLLLFPRPVFLQIIAIVSHAFLPRYLPGVCNDVFGSHHVDQSIAWEHVHSAFIYRLRLTPYNTISPVLRQRSLRVHIWEVLSPCYIKLFVFMTLWLMQPSFCKSGFLSPSHVYYLVFHLIYAPSLHLGSWHLLLNVWIAISLDLCQISLGADSSHNKSLLCLCLGWHMRFILTPLHMPAVLCSWSHLPTSNSLFIFTSLSPQV